ncbi:MAG TPA: helicase-related protein, partial [Chitinophagaceae bacterium]|nr:helicase-related protein [Chitinophagaceae bacterium]
KLVEILNNVPGSSIVYCRSRQRTREIAEQLAAHAISADFYHAGLPSEERNRKQEAWIKNNTRVMVCTNAFGMGIDKPDVRTVVHVNMPDCLENYYQEAGRAGRDGKKSYAVLLYQPDEPDTLLEQLEQRFPPLETVRQVYQAIANFLQLPTGSGEGSYINFDLGSFVNNFPFSTSVVLNVLKVLEQEGYLGFNEQVFLPARVQFVCNKDGLYRFEQEYPDMEPLLTLLLRSYEGIFDRNTNIFEKQLGGWLRRDTEDVVKGLQFLHRHHIIHYEPQKDSPQLYFLQPRMRAEAVHINQANYKKRKQQAEERLQTFIRYTRDEKGCRSQYIGAYFGDNDLTACGVCDNCLSAAKKQPLS